MYTTNGARTRRALAALAASALAATVAAGCGVPAGSSPGGRLDVVAAFYPLQFVTEQVGGDRVAVRNLVPPGTEPHDLELSPRQVAELGSADQVVYLKGFQPALDDAVADQAADKALDVAAVQPLATGYVPIEAGELHQDEKGTDPHVWLDPIRLAAIADTVAARLAALDQPHAARYTANATALRTRLTSLDAQFAKALADCAQRTIVVSHNAFGYLAARYRLTQVPITGLTPEEEPSPARLAEVARYAKDHHVRVIFFETLVSPKVARTLADEVGATAKVLDPIEGLAEGSTGDYFSAMRANLATLRDALRCR
ncbi:MAG TPA: metal ABC transporter substrate-binding protein [Cryptosporangiaceae bacterium]|nr:metal ABC transporter substrate-binding protein [Cryptosporangiaceae bacterium]